MARPKKYKTEEERKRARAGWNKKWIDKNLEKVRKNQRNSYRRRKKRLGEKLNLSVRKSRHLNRRKAINSWLRMDPAPFWKLRLQVLKAQCKKAKLDFNLTIEYLSELTIKQNFSCYYTHFVLRPFWGTEPKSLSDRLARLSIDRIDPNQGYVMGNIALVSNFINTMKSNLNENEFKGLIARISGTLQIKQNYMSPDFYKLYKINLKRMKKIRRINRPKGFKKSMKNVIMGRERPY